jgi:hypothetical protein
VAFPLYENTKEYRDMMKSFIKNYGAIYFATTVPDSRSRSFYNEEYNMLDVHYINHNSKEAIPSDAKYYGHAMIITGWDDNYGPDSDGDGKPDGAWIIQNSWGEDDLLKAFPYISYNSEIDYLRGIKIVEEKDWKNNYTMASYPIIEINGEEIEQQKSIFEDIEFYPEESENKLLRATAVNGTVEATYSKYNSKEALKYINFTSASQNSTYQIYVSKDGNKENYELIQEIKTDMPGLYTINCNDLELDSEKFSIKISSNSGAVYTQINAFTNDIEEKPTSYAYLYKGEYKNDNFIYHLRFHEDGFNKTYAIDITTKNGDEIIWDGYGKQSYTFNDGFTMNIIFPKELKVGEEYILKIYEQYHQSNIVESLRFVYNPDPRIDVSGFGTKESPYIINNIEDFKLIYDIPGAHYKLNNDINMSESNEILENLEINFCGVLDGNGHKFYNYSGNKPIFNKIEDAKIYNLYIDNFQVNNIEDSRVGLICNKMIKTDINNIFITGSLKGKYAGLLASEGNENNIKDVLINGSVEGENIGSVFANSYTENQITNCVIVTKLIYSGEKNGKVSGIIGTNSERHLSSINNAYLDINVVGNKNLDVFYPIYSHSSSDFTNKINDVNIYINTDYPIYYSTEEFNAENNSTIFDTYNEFIMKPLDELKLDKDIWEYLPNNKYPTLKNFPYYFSNETKPYKINKYDSDEEMKTISNIFPATIEHYKENINIQNPYTVKVFNGNEEITEGNIATGMITKIYLNDEVIAEYTNIVPGDVYADGKVSARDAGMIYQYFVGMLENFYGTPQYYAMDFSRDGKIRLNDAELIKRYGVKLYEPSEEDYYGENN